MSMSIYERAWWLLLAVCTDLTVGWTTALQQHIVAKDNFIALALLSAAFFAYDFVSRYNGNKFWLRALTFCTGAYFVYESSTFWGHYTLELLLCITAVSTTAYLTLLGRDMRLDDVWEQAKRNRASRIARKQHIKAVKSQDKAADAPFVTTGIGGLAFEH